MESKFRFISEEIRREIELITNKAGLFCRVFARGKSDQSITHKLSQECGTKYALGGRLIQDAIGVRVALYFEEDVHIVADLLKSTFKIIPDATTIDTHSTSQFTVTRHNLVLQIPDIHKQEMIRSIGKAPIDLTFEVQLRSILSEGWHEVDHDLRYKSKKSWEDQDDLSRALNGILATLETSEWSMRRIFDDLAYRHYKLRNWSLMLHAKVRLRVSPNLNHDLLDLLNKDHDFAKGVFRTNRKKVIKYITSISPSIPISLDNIVYVWNYTNLKNSDAFILTPRLLLESLRATPSLNQ